MLWYTIPCQIILYCSLFLPLAVPLFPLSVTITPRDINGKVPPAKMKYGLYSCKTGCLKCDSFNEIRGVNYRGFILTCSKKRSTTFYYTVLHIYWFKSKSLLKEKIQSLWFFSFVLSFIHCMIGQIVHFKTVDRQLNAQIGIASWENTVFSPSW